MNVDQEKFEDRGDSDFKQRQGANQKRSIMQKEMEQKRKLGIKPTDTSVDLANAVSRDVLGKVLAEQPAKISTQKDNSELDTNVDDEENDKDEPFNHEDEKRIKTMQALNPRIVKTRELKNYRSREDIKEEIFLLINEIATHKLNLYKTLIAIEEGKKENREKLKNFMRNLGTKGVIKGFVPFDANHSPLRSGRAIAQNVPTEKQQQFNLIPPSKLTPDQQEEAERRAAHLQGRLERGEISSDMAMASDAEDLRQAHYGLHEEVTENSESLSEANRNIMRQGRTNVVRVRIRKGKVQRRRRVSAVKGYTIRGGKLKRMSMQERIRRKRGQRRGKIKRKAKMARALMKRRRSMRRRAALGV